MVLDYIEEANLSKVIIFSDSLSVFQSINNSKIDNSVIQDIILRLHNMSSSTWNPRINVLPGQPFSVNSGTYLNGASVSQGAGQSVSVATTAVIPGTGNIPHYSNSGAGNQGTGRPIMSVATSVNSATGNIPRYSNGGTGNQGQLRSNIGTNDRNGSVNMTGVTGQSQTVNSGRDLPTYTNL